MIFHSSALLVWQEKKTTPHHVRSRSVLFAIAHDDLQPPIYNPNICLIGSSLSIELLISILATDSEKIALATEQNNMVEQKIEKPQTIDVQQPREFSQRSSEHLREFNFSPQGFLSQTYKNKIQWQSILDEI